MATFKGMSRGVRPRTLLGIIALIIIAAAIVVAVLLYYPRGGVELVGFSKESTATVSYAGMFPAEGEPNLLNPLGIVSRAGNIYVSESDAGRIRVFGLRGQDEGSIVLPVRAGAPTAYPSDIATLGTDRLVVVDNSGSRILILDADPKAKSPGATVIGESGANGVKSPTAVAVDGETIYVADGGDLTIKAYGSDGAYLRTVVKGSVNTAAYAGGLVILDGTLYATDSNAGRMVMFDIATGTTKGTFPGSFALPRGVGVGIAGDLLVVDTFQRVVKLLSPAGAPVDVIDGSTDSEGSLGSPRGTTWVASTGRVYVTDAQAGRVVVFNMRVSD